METVSDDSSVWANWLIVNLNVFVGQMFMTFSQSGGCPFSNLKMQKKRPVHTLSQTVKWPALSFLPKKTKTCHIMSYMTLHIPSVTIQRYLFYFCIAVDFILLILFLKGKFVKMLTICLTWLYSKHIKYH